MNNLPLGSDLLNVARETLLSELRPILDERGRYTLAMVANAMSIAAREVEAGEAPALSALARLDKLHKHEERELHGVELAIALSSYERQVAADIRAGRYDIDTARQRALLEHLRKTVRTKLEISNPKSLSPPKT